MKPVGLITFHAAYNVGSVMQAYATQQAIESLGYDCDVINYRTYFQRRYYGSLVRTKDGIGNFLRDVLRLPSWRYTFERMRRYEAFISTMALSEELTTPEKVVAMWSRYETVVSGSDQIWNRNALELRCASQEYMDPYLLVGFPGKKVSYASSLGSINGADLEAIGSKISVFEHVSAREQLAIDCLDHFVPNGITRVLDPTLLLDGMQWNQLLGLSTRVPEGRYLVCYTLRDIRVLWRYLSLIRHTVESRDLDYALVISPFANNIIGDSRIRSCPGYGPCDILAAIFGASAVITDSFHGTAFSASFGKDFLSVDLGSGTDYRKTELLELLRLTRHSISLMDIDSLLDVPCREDGGTIDQLPRLRAASLEYLRDAICK